MTADAKSASRCMACPSDGETTTTTPSKLNCMGLSSEAVFIFCNGRQAPSGLTPSEREIFARSTLPKKRGCPSHAVRRVQPYHLGCIENQWYVFGFDLVRQQIRTFALPRTRKVRDTRTGFRRPADFSIS